MICRIVSICEGKCVAAGSGGECHSDGRKVERITPDQFKEKVNTKCDGQDPAIDTAKYTPEQQQCYWAPDVYCNRSWK